jgi:uncharacterized membrane protein required for colicin V production
MDAALVGFVAAMIFGGWRTGLIRRLLGLVFLALSLVIGAYLRYPVGAIATTFFKGVPADYANLVGYTIAFPAILAGLHIASHVLLPKTPAHGLSREIDALAGAIFGGIEAVLILTAAIVIFDAYVGTGATILHAIGPGLLKSITEAMNGSTTVRLLRDTTVPIVLTIFGPILPKDLSSLVPAGLPTLPGGLPIPKP